MYQLKPMDQPILDNNNKNKNNNFVMCFDGCSKGNPGPAGAGAVIYNNDEEIWSASLYLGKKETNNCAEYQGLILGFNSKGGQPTCYQTNERRIPSKIG